MNNYELGKRIIKKPKKLTYDENYNQCGELEMYPVSVPESESEPESETESEPELEIEMGSETESELETESEAETEEDFIKAFSDAFTSTLMQTMDMYSFLDDEDVDEEIRMKKKRKLDTILDEIDERDLSLSKVLDVKMPPSKKRLAVERILIYNQTRNPMEKFLWKLSTQKFIKQNTITDNFSYDKDYVNKIKNDSITCNLKHMILKSHLSDKNKSILYNQFKIFNNIERNGEDRQQAKEIITTALSLPTLSWNLNTHDTDVKSFLTMARNKIDNQLYGMDSVKSDLLMIVYNKLIGRDVNNSILCLLGVPGTGKTTIVKILAEILNIPFIKISLGGVNDVSYLTGHSSTYVGAQPGIIVQKLTSVNYDNGIIFFDEFDKLTRTSKGQEVASAFLHILDEQQNKSFQDKFLQGIDIDLSKNWFIVAGNEFTAKNGDPNMLMNALQDRLNIINLKSYDFDDKLAILKNYFIPNYIDDFQLKDKIVFTNEICKYIISLSHKHSSGVRLIKEHARLIINKIKMYQDLVPVGHEPDENLKLGLTIPDYTIPTVITTELVDKILKIKKKVEEFTGLYI
jgi:ATP-dependent Lon protease